MAPGIAGNVYAFSLRFEKGVLGGDLQEVQPFEVASHQRVNIRWDTQSPYPNATWLLGGVAQVELPHGYQKLGQDGIQIQRSGDDFFWDHVQQGHGSALILLLPVGYSWLTSWYRQSAATCKDTHDLGQKNTGGESPFCISSNPESASTTSGPHGA